VGESLISQASPLAASQIKKDCSLKNQAVKLARYTPWFAKPQAATLKKSTVHSHAWPDPSTPHEYMLRSGLLLHFLLNQRFDFLLVPGADENLFDLSIFTDHHGFRNRLGFVSLSHRAVAVEHHR
jgi:hypothetical protein